MSTHPAKSNRPRTSLRDRVRGSEPFSSALREFAEGKSATPKDEGIHVGGSTEEVTVDVEDLVVDDRYQRSLSMVWARTIAREFDLRKFDKPLVARRSDGKFAVIDGQHRVQALKIRFAGQPITVKVDVLLGSEGVVDEASKFEGRNVNVKKPDTGTQLKAMIARGDADAIDYANVVEMSGFRMKSGGGRLKPGDVHAYAYKLARKTGGAQWAEHLFGTLVICRNAWGTTEFPLTSSVIGGLVMFLRRFGDDDRLNKKRLIQVLQRHTPMAIEAEGRSWASMRHTGTESGIVLVIISHYNKRLDDINKLPEAV